MIPSPAESTSNASFNRSRPLFADADVWDLTVPWVRIYWNIETLRRYWRAGYTLVSLTIQDAPPTFAGVLEFIAQLRSDYSAHSDWLTFAANLGEVDQARAAGKLALSINVQDTVQIGEDLTRVKALRDAGVWHMLLAYQTRNLAADGCAEPANAGLSIFGRKLVAAMNAACMVVDCSHTGRRSSLEAIEISQAPVIFSHSNAYAVCTHIRNIHDDQIKACAASGGAVGVVGIGAFLGDPKASVESVFRHIDHIAQLVGPDHIGIGSDFIDDLDYVWPLLRAQKDSAWPDPTGTQLYEGGCFQPEQLGDLVEHLLARGYADQAVRGILGGNFQRVYRAVLEPR